MTTQTTQQPASDGYLLGYSEHETNRLIRHHQLCHPITRALLSEAGITRGLTVLDLGSGAGDVAMVAAELMGPTGRVIGIDANPSILATARARAAAAGWDNIELRTGDLHDLRGVVDEQVDAVIGRWILMHWAFHQAGLPRPQLRLEAPVGGG